MRMFLETTSEGCKLDQVVLFRLNPPRFIDNGTQIDARTNQTMYAAYCPSELNNRL